MLFRALQRLDDRRRAAGALRQDHPNPLCPLEQLDDHRRAADPLDRRHHVLLPPDERRGRDSDVVAAENLDGAKLVAGHCDRVGRVQGKDTHLLELPEHGGPVEGYR